MAGIPHLKGKPPNSTIGDQFLEKLLPDTCKIHLAALHHFHFATQHASTYIYMRFNDK
jgi:hypothetical protein